MDLTPCADSPAVDAHAAARLARDCAVMDKARRLADWIGDEARPVTAGQVLRRADAAPAGAALGVAVPGKVRTAADVPALHRPWCVAVATGLLKVGGGQVTAGPALGSWPPADDGELLAGWLAGLRAVCEAEAGPRDREDADLPVLALLDILTMEDPPTGHALWEAVHETIRSDRYDGFYHFRVLDRFYDLAADDPLGGLFALLEQFGAICGGSDNPEITPLGEWAAERMLDAVPGSVDPGLSPADLLVRLAGLGDKELVWEEARRWLDDRTDTDAARQLLTAAADATPQVRSIAVDVVDFLGEAALPVWQEVAGTPCLGPHARAVLVAWDQIPALDEADRIWLVTEAAAAALVSHGPDEALSRVYEGLDGADLPARIAVAASSGHPDAEGLSAVLTEFVASGAPRTVDQILQVKVTLAGWRPPKWRRVLVPATASLHDLHRIVQVLFGWDGDHMHAFSVGRRQYSDPFFELEEAGDEYGLRVAQALTPATGKVIYTYDFGSSWRHEIVLEKTRDREPGQAYPFCVAFKGDSPVEYWSEEDPAGPEPFSQADVNRRLASVGG